MSVLQQVRLAISIVIALDVVTQNVSTNLEEFKLKVVIVKRLVVLKNTVNVIKKNRDVHFCVIALTVAIRMMNQIPKKRMPNQLTLEFWDRTS